MALTVDEALRKLAPLRAEDVRRWKRQLPFLDAATRKLVEWKILATAAELLGDAENLLLLSCPPRETCRGDIELGRVAYERDLWSFHLLETELLQHVAIFGRSGSGKTNVVFHVLRQLVDRHVPFLFFDWKRTARHLLPTLGRQVQLFTPGRSLAPFSFNPFLCPPGVERPVHLTLVVDLLGRAFTLGDGAKSLLQRALANSSAAPSVAEVLAIIEGMNTKGRQHGWKSSAVRCLQTLLFTDLVQGEGQAQAELVKLLFSRSSVLELNGLNEGAKRFLVPSLLHWIYQVRLGSADREKLRLVVVLEEAHNLLGDRQSEHFLGRFLRQCRELGIGVILVDQAPSLLGAVALGNTYATVCLNLRAPDDIRAAGGLLLLSEKDRAWLSRLPVGRGIVKLQDRWRSPFVLQFPRVAIQKGAMTDDRLRLFLAGVAPVSARSPTAPTPGGQVREVRLSEEVLESPAFEFLLDVLQHPDSGVRERYRRLAWSVDRGNRLKQQLLRVGLLEGALLPLGTTRKLVLRPTQEGRRLLGLEHGATIESLAHEFWKRRLAAQFAEEGWQVLVEGPRLEGRPELGQADLVVAKAKKRWAIEVETGKSNVVENVRNGLRAGLSKVLVVPTDGKAMKKVERQLGEAGLLIEGRVAVSASATEVSVSGIGTS